MMENGFSRWRALGLGILILATTPALAALHVKSHGKFVPGEMVVKLKEGVKISAVLKASRSLGVAVSHQRALKTDKKIHVVKFKQDRSMRSVRAALESIPGVAIAEPNFLYYAQYTSRERSLPNDPRFGELWGLLNTGQNDSAGQTGKAGSDINVVPLWEEGVTGNDTVKIAVIDTGVAWDHPDLKNNIFRNSGEIAGNGIDDDGNGFVDDIHGWNFVKDSFDSNDDHDHGTHCAGTIAAEGDNGIGVVGVAWEARIVPVKFLSASGSGTLADAVDSINYATMMGVDIMSNSWGGGGYSQTLKDSIIAAEKAGILFVAAAGNDSNNNDKSASYPASYQVSNVVSVAATDNRDKLATFSNYGKEKVHVAAPGVKILSTVADGSYASFSGTSMATPHVSGMAALVLSENGGMSFGEIKARLIGSSDPVSGLRRKVKAKGRVNMYNTFHNIQPPSDEPDDSLWEDQAYDLESEHPYPNSTTKTWEISQPGASYIRVHFSKLELEEGYDRIYIENADGDYVDDITGDHQNYTSEYVKGDKLVVKLVTDYSVQKWGFSVDKIQVIHP